MSFGNGGSYFGTDSSLGGNIGKNHANLMANDVKALLYVFSPNSRGIGDVAMRPLAYQWDENFLQGVQEITDQSRRGVDFNSSLVEEMMNHKNFSDNMTVSHAPSFNLRTSLLNDKWRFILILTDKGTDLIGVNTVMAAQGGNNQIRRIYTGYFEDEPFNPTTISSYRRTLNPHSYMTITHKTVVGLTKTHGMYGVETQINTRTSEEIILPHVTTSLAGMSGFNQRNELHLMTPENCVNSFQTTEDGYSLATPGISSNITNDVGARQVSDLFEQPEHNVNYVLKGLLKTQDDHNNRKRMSTRKSSHYFDDDFLGESFHRSSFARNLSLPASRNMSPFDLDVNSKISAQDLDNMVNHDLDVIPLDMETPMFYETADQTEISVTNRYSFLIATVMSPILNSAGLNEYQFEYQRALIRNEVKEDFRTISAAGNWVVPNEDLAAMVRAVQTELSKGIFETIFQSAGDFHVMVSAFATGITTVRLSLVGQGYKCQVDFELPSYLGGIISPLIGTDINNADNTSSIESLYGIATGSAGPGNYFNEDDLAFRDHANTVNFDDPSTFGLDPWGEELS